MTQTNRGVKKQMDKRSVKELSYKKQNYFGLRLCVCVCVCVYVHAAVCGTFMFVLWRSKELGNDIGVTGI
jgi:hypothetical protein